MDNKELIFFIAVNIVLGFTVAMVYRMYNGIKSEMKVSIFRMLILLITMGSLTWFTFKKIDNGYKLQTIILTNTIDSMNRVQYKFDSIKSENILLIEKVSKFENTMNLLEKEDTACYTEFVRRFVLFE